jgi:hypothetical protein
MKRRKNVRRTQVCPPGYHFVQLVEQFATVIPQVHIVLLANRSHWTALALEHAAESHAPRGNAGSELRHRMLPDATRIYLVQRNINAVARHENYGAEMC